MNTERTRRTALGCQHPRGHARSMTKSGLRQLRKKGEQQEDGRRKAGEKLEASGIPIPFRDPGRESSCRLGELLPRLRALPGWAGLQAAGAVPPILAALSLAVIEEGREEARTKGGSPAFLLPSSCSSPFFAVEEAPSMQMQPGWSERALLPGAVLRALSPFPSAPSALRSERDEPRTRD